MTGELLEKKVANALFPDVAMNPASARLLSYSTLGLADPFLKWLRRRMGGLWVGGVLSVNSDRLRFEPNGANQIVQEGTMSLDIPYTSLERVVWRSGVMTGIVELTHNAKTDAVRFIGAKALAGRLEGLRRAIQTPFQS